VLILRPFFVWTNISFFGVNSNIRVNNRALIPSPSAHPYFFSTFLNISRSIYSETDQFIKLRLARVHFLRRCFWSIMAKRSGRKVRDFCPSSLDLCTCLFKQFFLLISRLKCLVRFCSLRNVVRNCRLIDLNMLLFAFRDRQVCVNSL